MPALNYRHGDVLQFSPVSPVAISETLREAGRQRHPFFWYEFDAAAFDARITSIALDAKTVVPFDPLKLDKLRFPAIELEGDKHDCDWNQWQP